MVVIRKFRIEILIRLGMILVVGGGNQWVVYKCWTVWGYLFWLGNVSTGWQG